ncbi:MAG: glutaredoxin 3 [Pseudomonadota bacterium]|nr:glutaredoxin 3 [Pseudomonadota bacterium]
MPVIEIYSTPFCGYCSHAKRLLESKGVSSWTEVDIMLEPARRDEMIKRTGGRQTVPQIFIGGKHVGSYDDLRALDRDGKLEALLKD